MGCCSCGCGSSSGCKRRPHGPCGPLPPNTAACESLPSQIENFTKQFFGELVKTEIDGRVEWVLPCDLDIGLENNTRAVGEGLACYFLRLFRDGIIGITGPNGAAGAAGANGINAFTVSLQEFTQPTLGAPNVQVRTLFNPAILEELNVFIQGSGWYHVDAVDSIGNLYLTLTRALSGISGTIPAGRLVVPAGYPGESIVGPAGPAGPAGAAGPAAANPTASNGMYSTAVGTDYPFAITPTAINFTTSSPQLLLPAAGTYLLSAIVAVVGNAGINATDIIAVKFRNTTIAGDVTGSEQKISNLAVNEISQIVLNAVYSTAGANQTVALFGDCANALAASAVAVRTTLTYVRIG